MTRLSDADLDAMWDDPQESDVDHLIREVRVLTAERDEARFAAVEVDRLRDGIRKFVDNDGTHEPGAFVHDEDCVACWGRDGQCQGIQVCADCDLYWPCPTAELIALLDGEQTDG